MEHDFADDIAAVARIDGVETLLRQVCDDTGMGFAAVARVTDQRWIACQVEDRIEFGLKPGDELELKTTICEEIRCSGRGVYIDAVAGHDDWQTHHTPTLYGFQSYISVPITRADGSFFGTLCAIDPAPRETSLADYYAQMESYAAQIATRSTVRRAAGT
ncbi:MAG: GAF domain-containing protein [Pseudomonadota bacterium]